MRPMSQPRGDLLAEGAQAPLPVPGLRLLQVQPHCGEAKGDGRSGKRNDNDDEDMLKIDVEC